MSPIHLLFDLLAWALALSSAWLLYRWRLRDHLERLAERVGAGYFAALALGGAGGAYLAGSLNLWLSGQPGLGRSILGALAGAILAVELYKRFRGLRGSTGVIFALPFGLAVAVGRLGCHFAGLEDFTYGTPTALPWGHDYGDGIPRHPVALYESAAMGAWALLLLFAMQRRHAATVDNAFYLTVGWYAVQRFAWEFLKPYAPLAGPLNLFHLLCAALLLYAFWMMAGNRHART